MTAVAGLESSITALGIYAQGKVVQRGVHPSRRAPPRDYTAVQELLIGVVELSMRQKIKYERLY